MSKLKKLNRNILINESKNIIIYKNKFIYLVYLKKKQIYIIRTAGILKIDRLQTFVIFLNHCTMF